MIDDILTRLQRHARNQFEHRPCLNCDAAAEIKRLREENAVLKRVVGEEGRANRMVLLYESALLEIDRLRSLLEEAGRA